MLPLPVPEPGGSIEALRSFLNLSNQNDFVLVVAWLLAALRSSGPYPLLAISGEQGSAKQFYQSSSGRWSIPMRPRSERSRGRSASS
jgi:hypothetical protein